MLQRLYLDILLQQLLLNILLKVLWKLKLFFDEQQVIPTEINNLTGPTTSQKVLNNMEDTYSFIFQFAEVFSSSPTETILDKNLTVELSKQKKIVLIDTRRMPVFPQDAYVEIF